MSFMNPRWMRAAALTLFAAVAGAASPAYAEQPVPPAVPTAPVAPSAAPSVAPSAGSSAGSSADRTVAPVAPQAADPADPAAPGRYDRRLELPSTPAYFDDASRLPMAPIIVQPTQSQSGDRPTMWIGGLLVLVAVFLWNRSRRQEVERLEAAASRRRARHGAGAEGAPDEDAAGDDLPAAPDEDAADLASAAAASKKEAR
jgi:hypothetical protein